MAAANGHLECAGLLLKCPQVREVSLNSVNTEGNTPYTGLPSTPRSFGPFAFGEWR